MNPLISINVLTFNSEKYIENCIVHLFRQKYTKIEINIIDNNSSDNTIKILSKYKSKVNIYFLKSNLGYCGGHNIGIGISHGEFILVLNPDVFLDKNYVENIVKAIQSIVEKEKFGGAIGMLYRKIPNGSHIYIDTMGLAIRKDRRIIARNYGREIIKDLKATEEIFGVDGMAAIYSRKFLNEVKILDNYFDNDFFAYCEDQDLSWRGRRLGWKFYFIPTAKALHVRTFKPGKILERQKMNSKLKTIALRNHYLMVLKNDTIESLIKYSPYIIIRLAKIIIYSIIFERNNLSAFIQVIDQIPQIMKKRRMINLKIKNNTKFVDKWIGKLS